MSENPLLIIPLMIVTLLTCSFLIGLGKFSVHKYDSLSRDSAIDGLRGLLSVSVLAHHFYITYVWKISGSWVAPTQLPINNLGAISVSLFFMITGFLFIRKIKGGNIIWLDLYKGRLKRIYPLYIFIGIIVLIITLTSTKYEGVGLYRYIKSSLHWVFFSSYQVGTANTGRMIAGVNWTLLYEWGFYLSLPIIACFLNRKNKVTPMLIVLLPVLIYIFHITSLKIYFLFVLSYLSTINATVIRNAIARFKVFSSILTLTLFMFTYNFTKAYSLLQMILVLLIFIMICNGESLFGFLKLKGMKVLGDISYSIYLTHGLVLYISFSIVKIYDFNNGLLSYYLYYPLIVLVTILVSFITYSFIEHPSFKAKKKRHLPQSTF